MVSDTLLHPPPAPPADRLDAAIRDAMRPGVIVISGHASVARAQRALLAHGVHAILVLDDDGGRPLGWVTSRGLLRWAERDISPAPHAMRSPRRRSRSIRRRRRARRSRCSGGRIRPDWSSCAATAACRRASWPTSTSCAWSLASPTA